MSQRCRLVVRAVIELSIVGVCRYVNGGEAMGKVEEQELTRLLHKVSRHFSTGVSISRLPCAAG